MKDVKQPLRQRQHLTASGESDVLVSPRLDCLVKTTTKSCRTTNLDVLAMKQQHREIFMMEIPQELFRSGWSEEAAREVNLTRWAILDIGKATKQAVGHGIRCLVLHRAVDEQLARLCSGLTQLDLSRSRELTDRGLKALSRLDWLTSLNVSRCESLTDKGMRCLKYQTRLVRLIAVHLSRITDLGTTDCVKALSRLSLREINLSYCSRLSKEVLAWLPRGMKDLDLSGLPRLENAALGHVLCEMSDDLEFLTLRDTAFTEGLAPFLTSAKTTWGSKRHKGMNGLQQIDVADSRLGESVFCRIMHCCPQLRSLRYCGCLGVGESLSSLSLSLTELDLWRTPVSAACLSTLNVALRRLDLRETGDGLEDENIVHLARLCNDKLRRIRLSQLSRVGLQGATAIAKHCTGLIECCLRSLPRFTDKAAIIVSRRCRKLNLLDLGHCSSLSAWRVIPHVGTLRYLTALDASSWLNDSAIQSLPRTLLALRAKNCRDLTDSGCAHLAEVCGRLRAVDLTRSAITCKTLIAVVGIVAQPTTSTFQRLAQLRIFILSLREQDRLEDVKTYLEEHPYLVAEHRKASFEPDERAEFCGLALESWGNKDEAVMVVRQNEDSRDRLARDEVWINRLRAKNAAVLMQRNYRAVLARRDTYRTSIDRVAQRDEAARLLQRVSRGMRARRRARAARRITFVAGILAIFVLAIRLARKARHRAAAIRASGKRHVLRRYFAAWASIEWTKPWNAEENPRHVKLATQHARLRSLAQFMVAWRQSPRRCYADDLTARAFWARRRRRPLFVRWRRAAKRRFTRRVQLVVIFLQCVNIETYNSEASAEKARISERHVRQKMVRTAWTALRQWFLSQSSKRRRIAVAIEAVRRRSFREHSTLVLRAWQMYAKSRRCKRRNFEVAEAVNTTIAMRSGFTRLHTSALLRTQARRAVVKGESSRKRRGTTCVIALLRYRCLLKHRLERANAVADDFRSSMLANDRLESAARPVFEDWHAMVKAKKRIRTAFERARLGATATTLRLALAKFRLSFAIWQANRAALNALCSAAVDVALSIAAASSTSTTFLIELAFPSATRVNIDPESSCTRSSDNLHQRQETDLSFEHGIDLLPEYGVDRMDDLAKSHRAAIKLQSTYRAHRTAIEANDFRIWRDHALLRIQKNARRRFAYRAARRERRHVVARRRIVVENERYAMELEENMSRQFELEATMWRRVATMVRSYLACKRTRMLRVEVAKQRNRIFLQKRGDDIAVALQFEKHRQLEQAHREEAALVLQRRFRGAVGRRRFQNMLQYKLETLAAVRCQSAFRAVLGRRRAAALRRVADTAQLVRFSRQRQAFILRRVFRRLQRRTQRDFLLIAVTLGLDPASYTLAVRSQIDELCHDARDFVTDIIVEYRAACRAGICHSYLKSQIRTELRQEHYGMRETLQAGDAVRVIDPAHPRRGQTAYIVAIDTSIPEKLVAEVKFDLDGANASMPVVCTGEY